LGSDGHTRVILKNDAEIREATGIKWVTLIRIKEVYLINELFRTEIDFYPSSCFFFRLCDAVLRVVTTTVFIDRTSSLIL